MARHDWIRPRENTSSIEDMASNAELSCGGTNYFLFNGAATVDDIPTEPIVFSNLSQPKTVLNAPTALHVRGQDAGDVCKLQVIGINGVGDFVEEEFDLAGTTPVAIGEWWRVLRAEYFSGPALVGGAVVYDPAETDGTTLTDPNVHLYAPATMPGAPDVSAQRSFDALLAVPKGYEGYVAGFRFSGDKATEYALFIQARLALTPDGATPQPWQTILASRFSQSVLDFSFRWRRVPEGYEVRVLVERLSGTQSAAASLNYQAVIVRKKEF